MGDGRNQLIAFYMELFCWSIEDFAIYSKPKHATLSAKSISGECAAICCIYSLEIGRMQCVYVCVVS